MSEKESLRFDPSAGIILIDADLHGRVIERSRLVFDTGATYCMLPWKLVTALGIEINQNNTIQTTTASTIETSPIITIPIMTVLGFSVKNVSCIVRDLPSVSGVDGLLGLSFLKHFKMKVDFAKGELELSRSRRVFPKIIL
ncbi:clan AA aspartic protease [candidate division WWE3 bacterium]|nr:clan AA aspartic protease [candidate division WWE3 bacterium]